MKLPPAEEAFGDLTPARVAFTPKGGCPLKRKCIDGLVDVVVWVV